MKYYIFTQYEDGEYYDPTPFDNEADAWDEAIRRSTVDARQRWVRPL